MLMNVRVQLEKRASLKIEGEVGAEVGRVELVKVTGRIPSEGVCKASLAPGKKAVADHVVCKITRESAIRLRHAINVFLGDADADEAEDQWNTSTTNS